MTVDVSGPEELAAFRAEWTGRRVLGLLQGPAARVRFSWAVGVGKSHNIDDAVKEAISSGRFDLVVVLAPTRQILSERRWVKDPPPDVRIVNLRPRPKKLCGTARNKEWVDFESRGLTALGRDNICGTCPHLRSCFWPSQYGTALADAKVIFGTQTHLSRSPEFLEQLIASTGAESPLLILDEATILLSEFRRRIEREDLDRLLATLKASLTGGCSDRDRKTAEKWQFVIETAQDATTDDLRRGDWWLPPFDRQWAALVQKTGDDLYPGTFCFRGYQLLQFGRSNQSSREKDPDGAIVYSAQPRADVPILLYSGTASTKFLSYRFGSDFAGPFDDYRFEHPDTRWYNLSSRIGALSYFGKNSQQILDFFAQMIQRRISEGGRPLLIAKKKLLAFCTEKLNERLESLGVAACVAHQERWTTEHLQKPGTIPLIHYGLIGTNLFEEFDAAYCLCSFNVNEKTLNSTLQGQRASDFQVEVKIKVAGYPRRRMAGVVHPGDRYFDVHGLASHALQSLEMDTVLQAVGRVRPYTKPREIFTFQQAALPDRSYDQEFSRLTEARSFFGFTTRRERQSHESTNRVQEAKRNGLSQGKTAAATGLSLSTVKRNWNT